MVADHDGASKPSIASATAEHCWLCDRVDGDLCHVHGPVESNDREPPPTVLTVPKVSE